MREKAYAADATLKKTLGKLIFTGNCNWAVSVIDLALVSDWLI
tara:strand:- start:1919 stop:2047 length:129 start_codon:yes stop_codon:yes gene_type:complete